MHGCSTRLGHLSEVGNVNELNKYRFGQRGRRLRLGWLRLPIMVLSRIIPLTRVPTTKERVITIRKVHDCIGSPRDPGPSPSDGTVLAPSQHIDHRDNALNQSSNTANCAQALTNIIDTHRHLKIIISWVPLGKGALLRPKPRRPKQAMSYHSVRCSSESSLDTAHIRARRLVRPSDDWEARNERR